MIVFPLEKAGWHGRARADRLWVDDPALHPIRFQAASGLQEVRRRCRAIVGRIAGLAAADRETALGQLLILAGLRHLEEAVEQEVGSCASYDEARQLQRAYSASAQSCVIRYLGRTGGGD